MTVNPRPPVEASKPVPAFDRPHGKAHVVRDDAEAIAVARSLAAAFRVGASKRDRERIWPQPR